MDKNKRQYEKLAIDFALLSEFLEGIETFEFFIKTYPVEFVHKMEFHDFLFHLYSIVKNYCLEDGLDSNTPISKMMVLYGVSAFKQKLQTNRFIINFLICLDKSYKESPEVEFVVEMVNAFSDDKPLLKRKLEAWMLIKDKVVHHYTNIRDKIDYNLDEIVVNCNEWPSLFKGFASLFGKYESELLKKLNKKLIEVKIKDAENIRASLFCKAVFLMQEDVRVSEAKSLALMNKKKGLPLDLPKSPRSTSPRSARGDRNRELNAALEEEKANMLKIMGTLGRGALREENEVTKMFQLDNRDPTLLMTMHKKELIKGK